MVTCILLNIPAVHNFQQKQFPCSVEISKHLGLLFPTGYVFFIEILSNINIISLELINGTILKNDIFLGLNLRSLYHRSHGALALFEQNGDHNKLKLCLILASE